MRDCHYILPSPLGLYTRTCTLHCRGALLTLLNSKLDALANGVYYIIIESLRLLAVPLLRSEPYSSGPLGFQITLDPVIYNFLSPSIPSLPPSHLMASCVGGGGEARAEEDDVALVCVELPPRLICQLQLWQDATVTQAELRPVLEQLKTTQLLSIHSRHCIHGNTLLQPVRSKCSRDPPACQSILS